MPHKRKTKRTNCPLQTTKHANRWCCFCGGQGHLSKDCHLKKG